MNKVLIYVNVLTAIFCFLMFITGLVGLINVISSYSTDFYATLGYIILFFVGVLGLIMHFHWLNLKMIRR